ncbi:MAG: hypothetical protein GXP52_00265 [Deltaproteobacteria bacterium]|nr:hypothetical protein [Deltaproteobacteria bacterium]
MTRLSTRYIPAALALLILLSGCVDHRTIKAPEIQGLKRIKAVQVLVLSPRDNRSTSLWLNRVRKMGFNTVILRAFQLKGDRYHAAAAGQPGIKSEGVYFPTRRAPVVKDMMTTFVRLCHQEGLNAYAWMVTRKGAFGNADLPKDVAYSPDDDTFRTLTDLDIFDPRVRTYLKNLYMDLASTGVDGILLQDDLASRMGEGFTEGNLARYTQQTGDRVPPYTYLFSDHGDDGKTYMKASPSFERWVRWKTEGITSLARELENTVRKFNPGIRVIMNLTYEAVTSPENGRLWLSQDLRSVLDHGTSYAGVMLYHRQIQDELGLTLPQTLELLDNSLKDLSERFGQKARVVLKFQSKNWVTGERIPVEDLISGLLLAWGQGWSIAIVPPPSEDQLPDLYRVLKDM